MTKNTGSQNQQPSTIDNFKPLLIDVAVPLGAYYLFK